MIYLSLTQDCNYRCPCCPCKEHLKNSYLSKDKIESIIGSIPSSAKQSVTLSGGEPTIHPDFFYTLRLLYNKKIPVTLLTNSSKLTNPDIVLQIENEYPSISNLSIITTIYSIDEEEHDLQTGVKGSFSNSLKAIRLWNEKGAGVVFKHCITKRNVCDLKDLYQMIHNTFPDSVSFQLSGMDYIGMPSDLQESLKITCGDIKPHLDRLLYYIDFLKSSGQDRRTVYISSLPLCAASTRFKKYFVLNGDMGSIDYLSFSRYIKARPYDSRKGSALCSKCHVYGDCPGTYSSAFILMGDDFVEPVLE